MDMQCVMQIVFENPKTFEGISDAKKCNVIASAFRDANKNEQIQSIIIKNRAEVFSIRIFNCLLKNTQISNEFSKKFIDSVSIMCNKQNEMFRRYFKEYINQRYQIRYVWAREGGLSTKHMLQSLLLLLLVLFLVLLVSHHAAIIFFHFCICKRSRCDAGSWMLAHVCIRHILFSKGIFCLSQ
jgi:hypothetical protein